MFYAILMLAMMVGLLFLEAFLIALTIGEGDSQFWDEYPDEDDR